MGGETGRFRVSSGGRAVAGYELEERIGTGGMAVVFPGA